MILSVGLYNILARALRLRAQLSDAVGLRVDPRTAVGPSQQAVGFGIATPEQAAAVGKLADGVIVGSAFINAVDQDPSDPVGSAGRFSASLRAALEPEPAPPLARSNVTPTNPEDPTLGFLGF